MSKDAVIELVIQITTMLGALISGAWALYSWRKKDELFPRVCFEVTARFVGRQGDYVVTEVVAVLENTGVVPLKIKDFGCTVQGIEGREVLDRRGGPRNQLNFSHAVAAGPFIPATWEYTFVYPGVRTEYNYVTAIPKEVAFVRVAANFAYLVDGETHHAAKVLRVEVGDAGQGAVPLSGERASAI